MSAARCSRLAVLPLLSLAVACGPSARAYIDGSVLRTEHTDAGTPPDAAARDAAVRTDGGPPTVPVDPLEGWDVADAGPLSGVFAVEVRVLAKAAIVDVETRQLYRVRMLEQGRHVRLRVTPCRIGLPSVHGLATLSIGAAAEAVVRSKVLDVEGDYLSADDPHGAVFMPPSLGVLLGATLADPVHDPLPTMADETHEADEDMDGNPGISVGAETVVCRAPQTAYVALRASILLQGTLTSLDDFSGDTTPTLEQSVLGISDPCLAPATNLMVTINPGSSFRAVRTTTSEDLNGDGNVTCPEVIWASVPVFGDYWL